MKLIKLHLLVAAMIIVTSGCVGSGKKYKQQENSAAGVVDSKNTRMETFRHSNQAAVTSHSG